MGGQEGDTGGPSGVGGDATSILTDGTNQGGGGDLTAIAQATSGNGVRNVSGQFSGCQWATAGRPPLRPAGPPATVRM